MKGGVLLNHLYMNNFVGDKKKKVMITGLGAVSAIGSTVESHRDAISHKVIKYRQALEKLSGTKLKNPLFCVEDDIFDKVFLSTPPAFELFGFYGVSRTMDLFLYAALHALHDASISPLNLRGCKVGVAVGTTVGCTFNNEAYYKSWRNGAQGPPCPVLSYTDGNLASSMQSFLGASGPSAVIVNACSSGTDAIGLASEWIKAGMCDLVIAGGADAFSRIALNGFASLMLLSDEPCKPFDRYRKGLNLGEGAGVLVLESEESVIKKRREDFIKGFVRGYGICCDAWHPTAPHPDGRGLVNAVQSAIKDAGLSEIGEISFVNAHGTGTMVNDRAETQALAALGVNDFDLPIVSTKGMTGHTLGAAGGLEAVLTLLSLETGYVSGTVGCCTPDDSFACTPLAEHEYVYLKGPIGLSQSLAFGGGSSAVVLEAAV